MKNTMSREEMKEKDEAAPAVADRGKHWNLRPKRGPKVSNAGLEIEGKRSKQNSAPRNEDRGKWPRQRFFVSLSKKEIEEDFIEMTERRPPRRPQKRARALQEDLDMLFPGLWLEEEITADSYKVPEMAR